MSYYNQNQPPVGAPPPQGYPPEGYAKDAYAPPGYPPQGYPPQGYPPQGYPPQYAGQPPPSQHHESSSSSGLLQGWYAFHVSPLSAPQIWNCVWEFLFFLLAFALFGLWHVLVVLIGCTHVMLCVDTDLRRFV